METTRLNESEWIKFSQQDPEEPVVMINLLKFRAVTEAGVSGEALYNRYVAQARPFVEQVGGKVLWQGTCAHYLIGAEADRWDKILLVAYPSRRAFLSLIQNPDFQAIQADRLAALERAALIASTGLSKPAE